MASGPFLHPGASEGSSFLVTVRALINFIFNIFLNESIVGWQSCANFCCTAKGPRHNAYIYTFFFLYYPPSWAVLRDGLQVPALFSRTSLLTHSQCNSLHLPTPNSPSILTVTEFLWILYHYPYPNSSHVTVSLPMIYHFCPFLLSHTWSITSSLIEVFFTSCLASKTGYCFHL